jgi:hypothetical protein
MLYYTIFHLTRFQITKYDTRLSLLQPDSMTTALSVSLPWIMSDIHWIQTWSLAIVFFSTKMGLPPMPFISLLYYQLTRKAAIFWLKYENSYWLIADIFFLPSISWVFLFFLPWPNIL